MSTTTEDTGQVDPALIELLMNAGTPDLLLNRLDPGWFKRWPHIQLICQTIMAGILDPATQLIVITTQSQIGKSRSASVAVPTWLLDWLPQIDIIMGSYGSDLAMRNAGDVRNFFQTHPDKLRTTLRPDTTAKKRFATLHGGGLIAVGVDGQATGNPATVAILDDLIKSWAAAQSKVTRDAAWTFVEGDILRRLSRFVLDVPKTEANPEGKFTIMPTLIMIGTRYHLDDPIARALDYFPAKNTTVVHLPALADSRITPKGDPLGRADGEPVCPERFSKEEMEERRERSRPEIWATIEQGTPTNLEGGTIKKEKWVWADNAPEPAHRLATYTSWDLTFSDTGKSWVVGQLWCAVASNLSVDLFDLYLLDQIRRKADYIEQQRMFRAFARTYPDATHHLIEKKANGDALISGLRQHWIDTELGPADKQPGARRQTPVSLAADPDRNWPPVDGIEAVPVPNGKLARTLDAATMVDAGRVFLPSWWEPTLSPRYFLDEDLDDPKLMFPLSLINECAEIPNGVTDDEADTATQAIIWGRDMLGPILRGSTPEHRGATSVKVQRRSR